MLFLLQLFTFFIKIYEFESILPQKLSKRKLKTMGQENPWLRRFHYLPTPSSKDHKFTIREITSTQLKNVTIPFIFYFIPSYKHILVKLKKISSQLNFMTCRNQLHN